MRGPISKRLAPEFRHLSEVIILRVLILNNLGRWDGAATIGKGALWHYPDFGALYSRDRPRSPELPGRFKRESHGGLPRPYPENDATSGDSGGNSTTQR
jgi:hypothetical protein